MGNNRLYMGSLTQYRELGHGSYSDVYMADCNDSLCAYKEFKDPTYVEAIKDRVIYLPGYYGDRRYTFPYSFIYQHPKDENFKGYVMDLESFYTSLDALTDLEKQEKIEILRLGRDLVEGLHKDYGIIHGDLTPWNFGYDKRENNVILGDFDTNINLRKKEVGPDPKVHSEMLLEYFKNNGIDKDSDIFLYNICCYAYLNNINPLKYYQVLNYIKAGNFGVIESTQAQKVLETYKDFDKPKSIKKEYIIDYL